MTFEEFLSAVQEKMPKATEAQVRRAIEGREQFISSNMVDHTVNKLKQGLTVATIAIAPSTPQPSAPILQPKPEVKAEANTNCPVKKVGKGKLTQHREKLTDLSQKVTQKTQTELSSVLSGTVELVQNLKQQLNPLEDQLAEEIAYLTDPDAIRDRVLLKAERIKQQNALPASTTTLIGNIDGIMADLDGETLDIDAEALEEWISQTHAENTARMIAGTVNQ